MDNCLGVDRLAVNIVEVVDIVLADMMVDTAVGRVGMVVGMEYRS